MRGIGFAGWVGVLVTILVTAGSVLSGTTGRLTGRVVDTQGNPIQTAAIEIAAIQRLIFSGPDGRYDLLNLPPGVYEVRIFRLGYQSRVVQNVVISSDQTTTVDARLAAEAIAMEEFLVVADRPPVNLTETSTQANLTSEEIEALPVQELQDVVNLQAGVVDGHFRGGRLGEVQFQVDGITVNNPFNNQSSLKLDRSLLQEVQVISGAFDAEYGQAMSGVVNAVLKDGTSEFGVNGEVFAGSFVFPGHTERLADDTIHPGGIQNYQLGISGPLPANLSYLVSLRRYEFNDWVYGQRRFVPTDESDFENRVFLPTGDNEEVALGLSREWSGAGKLTSRWGGGHLSYQIVFNDIESRNGNFAYRFNPDGLSQQKTQSISHGLDLTVTMGSRSFFDVAVRQNYFDYSDMRYEDAYDLRYDEAGRPVPDDAYELGAIVQGVSLGRFEQNTNSLILKPAFRSQLTSEHLLKLGGELQLSRVKFGTPGHLTFTTETGEDGQTIERLTRKFDEPPDFLAVSEYEPVIGAAFLQDRMELPHMTVRAGLRLDYFDASSTIPSDLRNPANSIEGAPPSEPQATTVKWAISPRLGVAYPIQETAAVHFAYGHFRQFPPLGEIFGNADYSVLARLQAGQIPAVLGNPDVEPEQTVQYEIGYKQLITKDIGTDLTVFYKDIRSLLGVEFITTYTGAEYARLTNVDFGNVTGFTLSFDHRKLGPFGLTLDYTWQQALGNSSDPQETAARALAGEDPSPRLVPFNWDQTHTFNLTLAASRPDRYSVGGILRVVSGQPYTPVTGLGGYGSGLVKNSDNKPAGWVVDLRGELRVMSSRAGLFARVFNLFDTRYFNGPVFASTGSTDYSRLANDATALLDPNRFYPPRRIEIGVRVAMGGRR